MTEENTEYMSETEYRALEGYLYSTLLKTVSKNSAKHVKKINEPTEVMIFGTLVHMYILEPEKWEQKGYQVIPKFYPTSDETRQKYLGPTGSVSKNYALTKEGKTQKAKWIEKNDGNIITQEDLDAIYEMKNNMYQHSKGLFDLYLTGGRSEFPLIVEDFSVTVGDMIVNHPAKILVDHIKVFDHDVYLVDVKSCQDASLSKFQRDVWNFGYDIQAAFYVDVAKFVYPDHNIHFVWAATEKSDTHWFAFYEMSQKTYLEGKKKYVGAIIESVDYLNGKNVTGYQASTQLVML